MSCGDCGGVAEGEERGGTAAANEGKGETAGRSGRRGNEPESEGGDMGDADGGGCEGCEKEEAEGAQGKGIGKDTVTG